MASEAPRRCSPCGTPALRRISSRSTPSYVSFFLSCGFMTESVFRGIFFRSATVRASGVETSPATRSSAGAGAVWEPKSTAKNGCATGVGEVWENRLGAAGRSSARTAERNTELCGRILRCMVKRLPSVARESVLFEHYFGGLDDGGDFVSDF